MHLKEHKETIDGLRRSISEKEAQIINIWEDSGKSNTKLQEKVCLFFLLFFVTSPFLSPLKEI
jgi:hypothetical protein